MHMSLVYIEKRNYIKCGIFAHMEEKFFSENEMNQSEFLKIKIKGNALSKTSLYMNTTPFNKYT